MLGPDGRSIEDQIAPFMNPYMDSVIGGVRSEFDHLRAGARSSVSDAATRAGAFGGSRHGVAEAARLGELDRAQTGQVGGLLASGWQDALSQGLQYSEYQRALQERQAQEPLFRSLQELNLMNLGMGPTGTTSTTTMPGPSFGGQLLGAGLTAFAGPLSGLLGGGAAAPALFNASGARTASASLRGRGALQHPSLLPDRPPISYGGY
jgi:hypothetical protein